MGRKVDVAKVEQMVDSIYKGQVCVDYNLTKAEIKYFLDNHSRHPIVHGRLKVISFDKWGDPIVKNKSGDVK